MEGYFYKEPTRKQCSANVSFEVTGNLISTEDLMFHKEFQTTAFSEPCYGVVSVADDDTMKTG